MQVVPGARPRHRALVAVLATILVLAVLAAGAAGARWLAAEPDPDYVDIALAGPAPAEPAPGAGTYAWSCGRNEEGHRNTGNVVVAPGIPGPVHHVHDYVGNVSTDVNSTDASLAAAGTTCGNGDRSTYYWPVLRMGVRAGEEPPGEVAVPADVTLTAHGNPVTPVVAMPRLLRGSTGDARAATHDSGLGRPTWTCSGTPERRTDRYPRCPAGDRLVRVFDFPGCWDGRRTDSPDHRAHLVFASADGTCPARTFAVPRLRVTIAYDRPDGDRFAIDAFPDQRNSPVTDHAFFVNLMPEPLMAQVVRCLNTGISC